MDILIFVLLAAFIMRQSYKSAKWSQAIEKRTRRASVARKSLTTPNNAA